MDKIFKDERLNYAIERINEYTRYLHRKTVYDANVHMSRCIGCELVNDGCNICPFNIRDTEGTPFTTPGCRPDKDIYAYVSITTPENHQKSLIGALKKWCRRFYPEYTVEEI